MRTRCPDSDMYLPYIVDHRLQWMSEHTRSYCRSRSETKTDRISNQIDNDKGIRPFSVPTFVPSPQMPMVICICSKCSNCKITVDGVQQHGRRVSATTRLNHEKKDKRCKTPELRRSASPTQAPKHTKAPDPQKGAT
jgi:hypothetical protein